MRDFKGEKLICSIDSYTVIDIETTGFDPSKDCIIEVAAIRVRDNQIVDSYSSLINPKRPIPFFIEELTGIRNADVISAPEIESVLHTFVEFLGDDILVGHNVNFDINFIYDRCEDILGRPLTNDYIDTLSLSKRYFPTETSHKLSYLVETMELPHSSFHRALNDCEATHHLYAKLKTIIAGEDVYNEQILNSLNIPTDSVFSGKNVYINGTMKYYSYNFVAELLKRAGAKIYQMFTKGVDCVVFSQYAYAHMLRGYESEKCERAKQRGIPIYSEMDVYNVYGLSIPSKSADQPVNRPLHAKDITTTNENFDETHPLYGKICVFTGALEKMNRKEAMQCVVDLGGLVGDSVTKKTNYLILGNNDYNPLVVDGISSKQKKAEQLKMAGQDIDIISENVFYDMLDN